jgi:hypothetical protein
MKRVKVPLNLGLIDEGRFILLADRDLARLQETLLAYAAEHGAAADGAKAKLAIEITLAVDNADQGVYTVKGTTKVSIPARPASVTLAIGEESSEGPRLFVNRSGSSAASPAQGKFATDDGRTIDPETGEVLPVGNVEAASRRLPAKRANAGTDVPAA